MHKILILITAAISSSSGSEEKLSSDIDQSINSYKNEVYDSILSWINSIKDSNSNASIDMSLQGENFQNKDDINYPQNEFNLEEKIVEKEIKLDPEITNNKIECLYLYLENSLMKTFTDELSLNKDRNSTSIYTKSLKLKNNFKKEIKENVKKI